VKCLWEEDLEILIIYSPRFSARFRLGGIELNCAVSRIEILSGKRLKRAAISKALPMLNSCSLFRIVHLLETTEKLQLQVCFEEKSSFLKALPGKCRCVPTRNTIGQVVHRSGAVSTRIC
jgi:hypothetical protein